jgi:hypothetical protein
MDNPSSRRTLLLLLFAAWVVIDVALVAASWNDRLPETATAVVALACFFAQFATLAGWLSLGDGPVLLRVAGCVGVFVLLLGAIAAGNPERSLGPDSFWLSAGGVFSLLTAALLSVVRGLGLRCRQRSQVATPRLQFSLLQIFLLTTVTAVALAILKLLSWRQPGSGSLHFALVVSSLAAFASATWLLMFRLPRLPGVFVVIATAPLFGALGGVLDQGDYLPWLAFTLLLAGGLALNLHVLLLGGYELTRFRTGSP